MKNIVIISATISFGLIFLGLYFDFQDNPLKHKMYGFGTITMFLVTFPLFLFWRRNKMSRDKFIWRGTNPNKDNSNRNKKTEE